MVERDGAPVLRLGHKQQRRGKDTGPSAATRQLVLERDGYACVCCGVSVIGKPYSLQHRKRRSQGGDNSPCNLITVLGTGTTGCHERIDSRRNSEDEAKGYTCRSWQSPEEVPVMVFGRHGSGITVWLTPEGGYSYEPLSGGAALWSPTPRTGGPTGPSSSSAVLPGPQPSPQSSAVPRLYAES